MGHTKGEILATPNSTYFVSALNDRNTPEELMQMACEKNAKKLSDAVRTAIMGIDVKSINRAVEHITELIRVRLGTLGMDHFSTERFERIMSDLIPRFDTYLK